jgi:hypothetical protein
MKTDLPEDNPESEYLYATKRNQREIEAVEESLRGTKYDNPVPLVSTKSEKKQSVSGNLLRERTRLHHVRHAVRK